MTRRTLQIVRTGVTRTVILVGPWAVKVPTLRGWGARGSRLRGLAWSITRGVQANLSEWEMARWDTYREAVCPPVRCLAGIVSVYPRCEPLTVTEFTSGRLPDIPVPDKKIDNAGRLPDGRLVWLDYDSSWNGCPHSPIAHDLTREDEALAEQVAAASVRAADLAWPGAPGEVPAG